jgi:hypothetical protein
MSSSSSESSGNSTPASSVASSPSSPTATDAGGPAAEIRKKVLGNLLDVIEQEAKFAVVKNHWNEKLPPRKKRAAKHSNLELASTVDPDKEEDEIDKAFVDIMESLLSGTTELSDKKGFIYGVTKQWIQSTAAHIQTNRAQWELSRSGDAESQFIPQIAENKGRQWDFADEKAEVLGPVLQTLLAWATTLGTQQDLKEALSVCPEGWGERLEKVWWGIDREDPDTTVRHTWVPSREPVTVDYHDGYGGKKRKTIKSAMRDPKNYSDFGTGPTEKAKAIQAGIETKRTSTPGLGNRLSNLFGTAPSSQPTTISTIPNPATVGPNAWPVPSSPTGSMSGGLRNRFGSLFGSSTPSSPVTNAAPNSFPFGTPPRSSVSFAPALSPTPSFPTGPTSGGLSNRFSNLFAPSTLFGSSQPTPPVTSTVPNGYSFGAPPAPVSQTSALYTPGLSSVNASFSPWSAPPGANAPPTRAYGISSQPSSGYNTQQWPAAATSTNGPSVPLKSCLKNSTGTSATQSAASYGIPGTMQSGLGSVGAAGSAARPSVRFNVEQQPVI